MQPGPLDARPLECGEAAAAPEPGLIRHGSGMERRACTTGLRGGNTHSPAAGMKNRTGASSRGCRVLPLQPGAALDLSTKSQEPQGRRKLGEMDAWSVGQASGARIPREGACNWLLHCSMPQFPLQHSEEKRQKPGVAALPALAELRCPQAGSHRAPAKDPAGSRSNQEAQSLPPTGEMLPILRGERGPSASPGT